MLADGARQDSKTESQEESRIYEAAHSALAVATCATCASSREAQDDRYIPTCATCAGSRGARAAHRDSLGLAAISTVVQVAIPPACQTAPVLIVKNQDAKIAFGVFGTRHVASKCCAEGTRD